MNTAKDIRDDLAVRLPEIVSNVNSALTGGEHLSRLKPSLERLGRGGILPHWYEDLESNGTLPNLDGKSLGSVLEMVFVAVLERVFYPNSTLAPFRVNPARGVDIPDLSLGVKCPSENYNTSEPFFSAYERLLGNQHDSVILLTDYQSRKRSPPLRIQLINQAYLRGSQIADKNLCSIAKLYRDRILSDKATELKKVVRFLAYVNQSDWEAKKILKLLSDELDDASINRNISRLRREFQTDNAKKLKGHKDPIPQEAIDHLLSITNISPRWMGIVNAADNWVIEIQKDSGRYPNDHEWDRFLESPLDGVIGMSLALQWRYNFGPLFTNI